MSNIISIEPPAGMRVRFISDLHLGHERSEVPPIDDLAPLLDDTGMLVVAGDLAESRNSDWKNRALKLRDAFRNMCRQRGVELIEISGNHDPDVPALLARFWGGSVVAMHGHALFKEVAPWSWEYLHNREHCQELIRSYPHADTDLEERLELSRAVSLFTTPIMKRNDGVKNKYMRGLLHCFWPPTRPLNILRGWVECGARAQSFAEQFFPEAKVLITGHFHRSGFWKYPQRTIVNTGAWFTHATPYVLDMRDGQILSYLRYNSHIGLTY